MGNHVGGGQAAGEKLVEATNRMGARLGVAWLRLAFAALTVAAIAATYQHSMTASGRLPNVFNFFGYFTIQSNIFILLALAWAGLEGLRRVRVGALGTEFRAAATTYIMVTGIVYATLLAPLGDVGGAPVPWANTVLHIVLPIYAPLDWILFADRPRLLFRRLPTVLIYPAVWLVVVLIRGATDGWVPYPFLDPSNGYGAVAITCAVIVAVGLVFGALVYLLSRLRLVRIG
ncbi:Pr6Pr family membrane protein [Specibacter cremeus]|uniref:Pr6Pr family membrane protein n=1 Tax=Specibacter cremeus TaxID=1629051 RepID=UPI001F0BBFF2|nr:Pr6Pr family membrane protein [Specibacter cremeus]